MYRCDHVMGCDDQVSLAGPLRSGECDVLVALCVQLIIDVSDQCGGWLLLGIGDLKV